MKKFLPLLLFPIFLFYFFVSSTRVWAVDVSSEAASPTSIVINDENSPAIDNNVNQATGAAKVEYTLPYPGILPDNPLYFLKAARDKLVSFLISDPQKKAEFNLLTSDKRISSALILATRGKGSLSISTLSKSNNYLNDSVGAAVIAKNSGQDVDTVLHNLKNAILKHEEVLVEIKSATDKSFSSQLQIENKRLLNFEKTVDKNLPR